MIEVVKMKRRIMFSTVVVLIIAAVNVQADIGVWTFDELGPPPGFETTEEIPNGYGGFTWDNMHYWDAVYNPNFGYANGMVSQPNVAFNGWGFPASISGEIFNFRGCYLTGAWNDGLTVQVYGFLGGSQLYYRVVTVNATSPTWFDFNYYGIDRLEFSSGGGTPHWDDWGAQFVMDNFTIVPVPGAILLGILGLGVVGIKMRTLA
jgi:hypothetical protein